MEPTRLESALLNLFHELHANVGFPPPSDIAIVSRENTGGGRYVALRVARNTEIPDGYYDMGGRLIEMPGIPNGLMAVARVTDGVLAEIEIAVYGGDHWDGSEQEWTFK
jgi:hypothetical protein